MASDFVQEYKDTSLNYSIKKSDEQSGQEHSNTPEEMKPSYFCGELVKPGVLPGVLIGTTKVWRNGKETVTEVPGLFPEGAVDHITPSTSSQAQLSLGVMFWELVCSATMLTFGMGAKLVLRGLNKTVIHGKENIERVFVRSPEQPLLSVINHQSCFDDPGIWGAVLSPYQLSDRCNMRWGASASEVIFVNKPLATFFSLGKVVPIVRGWGVYQPAMEFLLERLKGGGWVNIFPEARVNADGREIRYRWGVGRLIWDCNRTPLLLPVVHLGMDRVLPNPKQGEAQSAVVRPGNLVTINIGKPVNLGSLVERLKQAGVGAVEARTVITQEVQDIMQNLYMETKQRHLQNITKWFARWHDETDVVPSILS